MPPKVAFHKEDILQAAIDLIKERGVQALTARNVANRLESSTAPVYCNFGSMQKLKTETLKRAGEILLDYAKKDYSDRVLLNLVTGLVLFARDNRLLFHALCLEKNEFKITIDELLDLAEFYMRQDSRFVNFSDDDIETLKNQMWIATQGFATLICNGFFEDSSIEYIQNTLFEIGQAYLCLITQKNHTD